MTNCRLITMICSLLAASTLAPAQIAPPAPAAAPRAFAAEAPLPPLPPAAPQALPAPAPQALPAPAPQAFPAPAPRPAAVPMPPHPFEFDIDMKLQIAQEALERAQEQTQNFDFQERLQAQVESAREMAERVKEQSFDLAYGKGYGSFAFAPQAGMGDIKAMTIRGNEDSLYQRGQGALDSRRWDDAVMYFNQAAIKGGTRTDGALYWKAYALSRLGKTSEAEAAIAELQSKHTASRWLDDAKALALQIKQQAGRPVSPEAETDEEMKILAINGLMQSDPERGYPLLEGILKGSASPKVKRNALYVLAQSSSPKAQALLEQVARGGGNPDLQVKAIQYMGERRRTNAGQLLQEIYSSSNDRDVKRAILNAYVSMRDKDRLVAVVKNEKDLDLKRIAINHLGGYQGNAELWQLYQSEATPEGKKILLENMHNNGNADKLLEVIKTEKDPDLRRVAIRALSDQRGGISSDALIQVYNSESDQQIKRSVLDSLNRDPAALISLAKTEKDPKMKLRIVEHISNLAPRSKEAADYLAELLK